MRPENREPAFLGIGLDPIQAFDPPQAERFYMNKPRVLVITMTFFAAVASLAAAEPTAFTADLKGSSEVPPTESNARGKAEVAYDDSTKTLRWTISYSGLTGSATAAHFHGPAREGENAGPMITISPLPSPMKGAAILTEDQSKALLSGNMYINVHTAKYPDGEIRGQLIPAS
jgi:CHRD domain